jgi:hypothetical protein
MQGFVYQLSLTDQDQGTPHPHVVVLTFSGNRDCIVVPAYSPEGFMVNEFIEAARKTGLREDQIFVRLDNAKQIEFTCFFTAKEAIWCTARFRRLSQKAVMQGKLIGQMRDEGLLQIARHLLALAEVDPRDLSPNAVKALRNLVRALSERISSASNSR